MSFTRASALLAAGLAAVSMTACSRTVEGHGVMEAGVTQQVAATVPSSPTHPPSAAPPRELTLDELVRAVNTDATEYWKDNGEPFPAMTVTRKDSVITTPCGTTPDPSFVCDGVLYYRADLLGQLHRTHGDVAVTEVIAHEVGHALLHYTNSDQVPMVTLETRADCASGAYTAEKFSGVSEDRARELFSKTALSNPDGEPDAAFTIGFRTQRRGQDTESMCTTYDYAH